MTTWRLLKYEDHEEADNSITNRYTEVGTHESEHAWSLGFNAPSEIGAYHGPGEYLLLSDDDRYKTLSIGARREFFEILDEEPKESEPVSLKAAPSAAEIMDREG